MITIKLRFKDKNGNDYEDWNKSVLGEIYSFISTNSLSRDKLNLTNGNVQNIHYGDIHTKFKTLLDVGEEKIPYINSDVNLSKIRSSQYCQNGDIVMVDAAEDYKGTGKMVEVKEISNHKILAGLHTIHMRPNLDFIRIGFGSYLLQNKNFRLQIKIIAQGTKVLSISSKRLTKLYFNLPSLPEQQKIADFLTSVDDKIQHLTKKKELITTYKKGMMQKLFSQELKFKDENGNDYEDWEVRKLNYYLEVSKTKNLELKYDKNDVLSVSGEYGIVNQIEFQGRSFAGESVHNYGVVEIGDIVYTKSPLKANPYGIIKVNKNKIGIVSTLYAVYKCKSNLIGEYLDYYFQIDDNTNKYLRPLVQKGSKNDMKINNEKVLIDPIMIPSILEQKKIINYFRQLDKKIGLVTTQIENTKQFKKGLLQQMFV